MAFVPSDVSLRSTFTPAHVSVVTKEICPRSATPMMSLSKKAIPAVKVLFVAGAAALGMATIFPAESNAALFHFRGERPKTVGLRYGRYLNNCPPTPNCISSMANVYDKHFVPAWTYNAFPGPKKTMKEAISDVTKILEGNSLATIIESKETKSEVGKGYYIYAEFESKLMGFVDDAEFFFQPDNETVEYRSASRLGERDFDVNRKRIRDIRVTLQDMDKRWASVGY